MAWNTKTEIFGLPLLSIGVFPRGIIAIGWVGRGFITIAQFGTGFIAITQMGAGFIILSQMGAGFFSVGQMVLGLIFGLGQFAIGFAAAGQFSICYYDVDNSKNIVRQVEYLLGSIQEDPAALVYWCNFLIVLGFIIFKKRKKIISRMSIPDINRSKLKK